MKKMLLGGMESLKRVNLLIELTRIDSEDIQQSLIDHLTKGIDLKSAAILNGVKQQNFSRALKRLNEVATTVEKIKELDWVKFQ